MAFLFEELSFYAYTINEKGEFLKFFPHQLEKIGVICFNMLLYAILHWHVTIFGIYQACYTMNKSLLLV